MTNGHSTYSLPTAKCANCSRYINNRKAQGYELVNMKIFLEKAYGARYTAMMQNTAPIALNRLNADKGKLCTALSTRNLYNAD